MRKKPSFNTSHANSNDRSSNLQLELSKIKSKGYIPIRSHRPIASSQIIQTTQFKPSSNTKFIRNKHLSSYGSEGEARIKTDIDEIIGPVKAPSGVAQFYTIKRNQDAEGERRFCRRSIDSSRAYSERAKTEKEQKTLVTDLKFKLERLKRQQQRIKKNTKEELQNYLAAIIETKKQVYHIIPTLAQKEEKQGLGEEEVQQIMDSYHSFMGRMADLDEQKQVFLQQLMKSSHH